MVLLAIGQPVARSVSKLQEKSGRGEEKKVQRGREEEESARAQKGPGKTYSPFPLSPWGEGLDQWSRGEEGKERK